MVKQSPAVLFFLLWFSLDTYFVQGNLGLFTYYETPLTGLGGRGPSTWRNLLLPNNHCGGIGQRTGFGQSPIVIPQATRDQCDTDLSGFVFEGGTCEFSDLWFRIVNNGVIVGPKLDATCSFGTMKIPGNDNFFEALQFHIHTNSEHSVDGTYYRNELHIVHRESNGNSFAVFGTFIDALEGEEQQDHPEFEYFLQSWEAVARQTNEFCYLNPEGDGSFTLNTVLRSRQMSLVCPDIGSGVEETDLVLDPNDMSRPLMKPVPLPTDGATPDLYTSLATPGYGIYSYRGGLTTPPCTEIVNWNLLDTPLYLSQSQVNRLHKLILCFVEISTCKHSTIANEYGYTSRPPQPLNGRTILHRCDGTNNPANIVSPFTEQAVPLPPVTNGFDRSRIVWPQFAVLYPWFTVILGVIVFFLLSRFVHMLPYTAVMFLLGTFMGIGIAVTKNPDQLSTSTRMWENINSELLLLTFLPGLLFRDAFGLNVHLFFKSVWQCLILAFPMVLAGTTLLAVVGYSVLPYGWSFSLAMTFGSILSATDPVAVSALLNEVGAPPRLKTHISGESLLNDGSAIVFYTIFANIFLFELGIPGLGQDIDVAQGFTLFFRMSLGAACIGLAFGMGLVMILYFLNRRYQAEENIVQVTATVAIAYLTYYVADVVCLTSGVIAVVICGIFTKAVGERLINDQVLMEKFWVMLEHILNTILFALGGVVWGTVISNADPTRTETFDASDWGYLALLYVLMMAIRFFLMYSFFPIISRIGLKTDAKEVCFLSFGGLRGAVGIALAIALDNELQRDTLPGDPRRDFTSQLFGMTGGVAFMTLLINGTLSGPLLRKLGLADPTELREKIVERYQETVKHHMLDGLIHLLGDSRFSQVNYATVRNHISYFRTLTPKDLKAAVRRNKRSTAPHNYKEPTLTPFRPFLDPPVLEELENLARVSASSKFKSVVSLVSMTIPSISMLSADCSPSQVSVPKSLHGGEEGEENPRYEETLVELRKVFIELLRRAYHQQIERGEIDTRQGFLVYVLNASLELTSDQVAKGRPICDWAACKVASRPWSRKAKKKMESYSTPAMIHNLGNAFKSGRQYSMAMLGLASKRKFTPEDLRFRKVRADVHRAVAFIEAHKIAQEAFREEFCNGQMLSLAERTILDESRAQVSEAEDMLDSKKAQDVQRIVSHLLCTILLNNAAIFVGDLIASGLLRDQEGEEYIEEIEHELNRIEKCAGGSATCQSLSMHVHPSHKILSSTIPRKVSSPSLKSTVLESSSSSDSRERDDDSESSDESCDSGEDEKNRSITSIKEEQEEHHGDQEFPSEAITTGPVIEEISSESSDSGFMMDDDEMV